MYAVLRMASTADAIVDSIWSGGIFCKIDIATERLVGDARGYTGAVYRAHPMTGVVFDGYQLHGVHAAVEGVRRAHTMLNDEKSRYFIAGPCRWLSWDIALVPPAADRAPYVVVEIDALHSPFFQFLCGRWNCTPVHPPTPDCARAHACGGSVWGLFETCALPLDWWCWQGAQLCHNDDVIALRPVGGRAGSTRCLS